MRHDEVRGSPHDGMGGFPCRPGVSRMLAVRYSVPVAGLPTMAAAVFAFNLVTWLALKGRSI